MSVSEEITRFTRAVCLYVPVVHLGASVGVDHLTVLKPGDAGRRCAFSLAAETGRTSSGSSLTLWLLHQRRRNCKNE